MHNSSALGQFVHQKYLNLETYRRNGSGVRTPLWFVESDGKLSICTGANSGEAKRMRNFPQVQQTPWKAQGEVIGQWVKGTARRVDNHMADPINRLFSQKSGWQKTLFDLLGRLQKFETTTYEIILEEEFPGEGGQSQAG